MKKWIATALLCCLLLSLFGCGSEEAKGAATQAKPQAEGLQVGYGKVNITPEESMPLAGYGNSDQRMSVGCKEYLYATCVAISDGTNMVLLYGIDMIGTGQAFFESIREELSKKLNIPVENIVISASHNHSCPDFNVQMPAVQQWRETFKKRMVQCGEQAAQDLAPATMSTASAETQGLNFVRHYRMEDGSVIGAQNIINLSGMAITGHATKADPELRLLKFDREEKKDILLANFQTHPHRSASVTMNLITPDLVGIFREELENALDLQVVYFTGAAGNINPVSLIKEENVTADYIEQGKALAKYAIDAEGSYTSVESGPVKAIVSTYEGKVDHSQDQLVSVAKEAQALWVETNDVNAVTDAYLSYGINGPQHAGAIINKAMQPQTKSFDIYALSFGDVAFAVAPYEMFDTNGMFIKENSPFAVTFVAECANGANGYFPSEESWEGGGYEVDITLYVRGTAEELANRYVEMLNSLAQ